nr:hypothetical protein [uncultured Oscillibacter sp.]
MKYNHPDVPQPEREELSPEERAHIARIFRRRAVITDVCLVLALACGIFALTARGSTLAGPALFAALLLLARTLAGVFLTYGCCPVCGRRPRRWDWAWTPLLWWFFRCPVCGFTPRRDGKRGGEPET